MVDHVVHILFLPGLHKMRTRQRDKWASTSSLESMHHGGSGRSLHPTLPLFPSLFEGSPLHLEVRVLSRLSFNESGRVAHHRDFVDIKELLSLIPGFATIQWLGSRTSARVLSWMSFLIGKGATTVEGEESPTTDEDFLYTVQRTSGLNRIRESQRTQAPDVDRG